MRMRHRVALASVCTLVAVVASAGLGRASAPAMSPDKGQVWADCERVTFVDGQGWQYGSEQGWGEWWNGDTFVGFAMSEDTAIYRTLPCLMYWEAA